MEGSVYHTLWTLQAPSHVLWAMQFSTDLSSLHGLDLWRYDCWGMAHHLHGWCPGIHQNQGGMPGKDKMCTWLNGTRRSPPKVGKMHFWPNWGGISGISSEGWTCMHGPYQAGCPQELGTANFGEARQILHWILQLLLKIHPQFLCALPAITWLDEEGNPLFLGKTARWCIHKAERDIPLCPSAQNARYN